MSEEIPKCNNCKIEMVTNENVIAPKIVFDKYHYFLCKKCGFEKRVNK